MRYLFGLISLLMLVAVLLQYNDPDGPLWMIYYGVPAVLAGLAAYRPQILVSRLGRVILGLTALAAIVLTVIYWPTAPGWWHENVWRASMASQGGQAAEESREGMGIMIATAVVLAIFGWSLFLRAAPSAAGR